MKNPTKLSEKKHWDDYDIQKQDGSWTTVGDLLSQAETHTKEATIRETRRKDIEIAKSLMVKSHIHFKDPCSASQVNIVLNIFVEALKKLSLTPSGGENKKK